MAQHPIGYVSRRTGLSTHVIRAWERRYNAVTPERTDTTRRLYSDADIERLRLLQTLSKNGLSISQVAGRTTAELKRLVRDLSDTQPASGNASLNVPAPLSDVSEIMKACQLAIEALDAKALDNALMEARVVLTEQALLDSVVGPLMTWVGDQWHDGTIRPAQEHLATAVVKGFLAQIRHSCSTNPDAPRVVVSTLPGQLHEIGALLAATLAAVEGWNELYLGPNLPPTDLANAAVRGRVSLLALSIAMPGDSPRLHQDLLELRQIVPNEIQIVVGGEGAKRHSDFLTTNRMRLVHDLQGFRAILRETRTGISNKPTD